jgi:hypothetical protein
MTLAQQLSFASEKRGADGNATFPQPCASFCEGGFEQSLVLFHVLGGVLCHFFFSFPF